MFMRHMRMENDFVYRPEREAGAQSIMEDQQKYDLYFEVPQQPDLRIWQKDIFPLQEPIADQ
jgi:hypothetical protein